MSYQVIARKWRPQRFDEVSGQAHVTTAIRNAIRTGRVPHAMLLTGPRGVGKTTLARLIARCLNCEKGPTDEPCGSCTACNEITEGRSTDVQEIDAASRTGVDDMREVIESIRYAAAPGKHRIYIIDEVHMLSVQAFNALLKTLEEPPPQSLFVFATTNPEKIPFTVLSRCQRHDLRRIALATVAERLTEICAAEGIEISPGALAQIAREGDGSMRDAQTLLDQIVAYGGETVSDATVAELLDLVDRRVLQSLVEACIAGDPRQALELLAQATSGGSEPRRIAEALLELLRDLVVLRIAPEGQGLFEGPQEERTELIELATKTEPARLRRMFRALVREIEDLAWAPQPTALLEMAVVRLATLPAGDDVAQLLARLDQLERRLAQQGGPGDPGGAGSAGGGPGGRRAAAAGGGARGAASGRGPQASAPSRRGGRGAEAAPDKARSAGIRALEGTAEAAGPAAPADAPGITPEEIAPEPSPPASPTAAPGGGAAPEMLFDRLRSRALETDRARLASLDVARLIRLHGETLELGVPGSFHADRLRARQSEIEALATTLFGQPLRITITVQEAQASQDQDASQRELSRLRRQQALHSKPVNLALEVLEAQIVEIRPLGDSR